MGSSRYQYIIQTTGLAVQAAEVTILLKHLKPGFGETWQMNVESSSLLYAETKQQNKR